MVLDVVMVINEFHLQIKIIDGDWYINCVIILSMVLLKEFYVG
jgi:hypothetical protein